MAKSIDIFIERESPITDLIKEIETLLGARLQFVSADGESWYEFRNSKVRMTLGHHEFENDGELNFEDYRFNISVYAQNIQSEVERQKWRQELAYRIFQKLKTTQKYRLILVDDIQKKLEEFTPEVLYWKEVALA